MKAWLAVDHDRLLEGLRRLLALCSATLRDDAEFAPLANFLDEHRSRIVLSFLLPCPDLIHLRLGQRNKPDFLGAVILRRNSQKRLDAAPATAPFTTDIGSSLPRPLLYLAACARSTALRSLFFCAPIDSKACLVK